MSLRDALTSGAAGLRWVTPASFTWPDLHPFAAVAQDPERRVTWFLRRMPWRIDLRPSHDEALRSDLEDDARGEFERAYRVPAEGEMLGGATGPRTADPRWSPLVEVERVTIGDAAALRVVRRITYQPGNEIVRGALLVPLADGYLELAAAARASTTGMRECLLVATRRSDPQGPGGPFLSQAEYDDPALDASFPDHPLTRVRAALRWLLADPNVAVTAPMGELPVGEVALDGPRCAIVPPPRFLFVPRAVLTMSPTLASMVRVTFPEADLRMLDVWRLDARITGGDRADRLRALARSSTDAWTSEGASDIEHSPTVVPGDGAAVVVEDLVRFKALGVPKVTAMRWRVDGDGTVFRVSAGAGPRVRDGELVEQAREVMSSLRRLDVPSGRVTAARS